MPVSGLVPPTSSTLKHTPRPDKLFLCMNQVTGDRVGKELLYKIGLRDMKTRIQEVARKFHCLQLDSNEYVCLRYLILLNEGT